jgi:hypothetical protein
VLEGRGVGVGVASWTACSGARVCRCQDRASARLCAGASPNPSSSLAPSHFVFAVAVTIGTDGTRAARADLLAVTCDLANSVGAGSSKAT